MKTVIAIFFIYSLTFANQPSFSALQNEIILSQNQCSFDISDFDENPSTGYTWSVSYDDKIFNEPKKEFILSQSKSGMVGVGGKTTFYFTIKPKLCNDSSLGMSKLTFSLARIWETSPIKTKNIEIRFKY